MSLALLFGAGLWINRTAQAQNAAAPSTTPVTPPPATPVPSTTPPAPPPNTPPAAVPTVPPPTNNPAPAAQTEESSSSDGIQLSFQGANVDMVVQWLASTTGKSVVKHPQVQCQLTIVSSKKLSTRDALNLVYGALALEGFVAIESAKSILIVPEGKEPKGNPELLGSSQNEVPDGRQKLVKIFPLEHVQAGDLKDKIRAVLTEKATIEVNDRSNQLIVTDYTDNIRLLGDLIKELDVASASDTVIEIFPLRHSEADELANLLGLILNAKAPPPGGSGSSGSRGSSPMPGMPMPPGGGPSPSGSSGGSSTSASDQIRLWPDKTANRLIVAAPKSRLPEVKKLIDLMDTNKPQDVTVRVLPLQNVDAADLVKEIGPLYQKMSGKSAKDVIEVTANNRSNSLIILSSEANYNAIATLIASLDTESAQEKVIRTFALRNADAQDVAKQLQELSQDQQNSMSRYFYYFSPQEGNRKKMNVVADRRRNSVIVQAPPGSMESIAQMIEELDTPVSDNSLAPRIFPLKYISAVDLEDVLNELFLKKQQQRNYWFYDDYDTETPDRDVGRLYGKVRIKSESYSNSLIVTSNSPEHLTAVEDVIKRLDVPSEAGETTLRIGLKFAEAVDVASSINILFAKGGAPPLRPVAQPGVPYQNNNNYNNGQQNSSYQNGFELQKETVEDAYYPWLGGQQENLRSADGRTTSRPVSDLIGRVRVVPDKRSNSLLITANVHFFPQVMKLVNDLDAPTAQVLIEAKIVEVASDFKDKLGVRWSPDGSRVFDADDLDNSIKVKTGVAYRDVFAGSAMADSLQTGILDTSVNLDFLIQFLRKNTDATVLAEPQINVSDNEMGQLFVGSQVPFISASLNTTEGGRNDTYTYKDVGVILEVTPHISNSEEVALKIRAESSNLRNGEVLYGGAIIDTRNFKTDLLVKSGQTVVLGGIIQREDVDTIRKVPILGSIPVLGWAFKKKDKISRNVELMVFLRPRITRTPQEAKELMGNIETRMPLIKRWTEETKKTDESKTN